MASDDEPPRIGRRPKLLDDDVREHVLDAIARGATYQAAALAAGISRRTFYRWAERGQEALQQWEETGEIDPDDEPYLAFAQDLARAHAQGQVANVVRIDRAAEGGYVVKSRTKRYRDPANGQLIEEREDDIAPPDWRAAAWILERRHPEAFGKAAEQIELSGPDGGPIPMGVPGGLAGLAERIVANVRALEAGRLDEVDLFDPTVTEDPDAV